MHDDLENEREGGDITAADMLLPETLPSEIREFYKGSTILLTGGTGFLGKIFLEKLLRTCHDLERIYVLIRPKKGKDVETRFGEIFEGPNFDILKRKRPNFGAKVTMVMGDCQEPDLGLSGVDQRRIIAETNCVIHCAATVRFDEKLRVAGNINVRAIMDLIKMAKQMKHLKAMLHISTAFSQCTRTHINEVFYDPPITGEKLLSLLDSLPDSKIEAITPIILGEFPNSYVFTKAIAEDVVKQAEQTLPIGLFRPSIVIASVKEPVAGWIDNLYGATGVLVGAAVGVLRSIHGNKKLRAEMVPADYVVNCALATLWDIATIKTINQNKEEQIKKEEEMPVYNYVSSVEKPLTWDDFTSLAEKHAKQIPSPLLVWHYFFAVRSTRLGHLLAVFFYHTIPAYLVDFGALLIGRKPMLVKGYQKINKFTDVISYFANREWIFTNSHVQGLWKRMGKTDRELFEFSMRNFNWDAYFYTYVRGARAYLLKDPLETVPQGTVKYYKLMAAHYCLVGVVIFLGFKILGMLVGLVF